MSIFGHVHTGLKLTVQSCITARRSCTELHWMCIQWHAVHVGHFHIHTPLTLNFGSMSKTWPLCYTPCMECLLGSSAIFSLLPSQLNNAPDCTNTHLRITTNMYTCIHVCVHSTFCRLIYYNSMHCQHIAAVLLIFYMLCSPKFQV